MFSFIGKLLGFLFLSLVVVMTWHFGTHMDPREQYVAALFCVMSAQNKTGMREQEIIQFEATRLFKQKEAWVQVVNVSDNSKTVIFCSHMDGELEWLDVDGKEIKL